MPTPDPFDDVPATQCPLMPSELVERYNALATCLRTLEQQAPKMREALGPIKEKMARVRTRLTRQHFQVGFIGENQIGKSSTFNNILGVRGHPDQPSQEGTGVSTTSAITRLHRSPDGMPHRLFLRYLSEEQYRFKRDRMCEAVGLDAGLPDAQVLELLGEQEKKIQAGEVHALAEDPKYLRKLIRSYQQYGKQVINRAAPEEVKYADRARYLSHNPKDDKPSPYLLLSDTVIEFQTDRLAPKLQLIDLPGLGAGMSMDTILTEGFLQDLDGALVCVATQNPDRQVVESALQHLRRNFHGDFDRRVWLVCTRFDALGPNYINGDDKGRTVFLNLAGLAEKHGIPVGQVCLVSNRVFEEASKNSVSFDRRSAALIIGVSHEPEIPPRLQNEVAGLIDAFREVLKDGGIGRLQTLLAYTLVQHVSERTYAWIGQQLDTIAKQVHGDLEFLKQASSYDLLPQIQQAAQAVFEQLEAIEGRTTFFDEARAALRQGMLDHFKLFFPEHEYLNKQKLPEVVKRFPDDARKMEEYLPHLVASKILPELYAAAGQGFQSIPAFRVGGQPNLAQLWDTITQEDKASPDAWKGSCFPTFIQDDLFRSLLKGEGTLFTGQRYRSLMYEKIRATAFQALHCLRVRLQQRLRELVAQLDDLTRLSGAEGGLASSLDINGLMTQLRKVCPSL